ncbi:hypothetical protein [Bartonella birtlesii]|uniref:Uncharacterized protein n=1 Tax=Bartonella birtlesii LL-WM9 TaxID=1094552 RepID=J1IT31_9HYPH|nr:hypothetical protein [Bartonella birtlesii]EJF74255.1 hypothetical protein ME7_01531 [Bartonella birtlesii LL-WM9]
MINCLIFWIFPDKIAELRGSNCFIDSFKTAGQEREEAIYNISLAISSLKKLQSFYKNFYEQKIDKFICKCKRLKVEVLSLSKEAITRVWQGIKAYFYHLIKLCGKEVTKGGTMNVEKDIARARIDLRI